MKHTAVSPGRPQGWRLNRQATHSPCPPEVPCLDLGRLAVSDKEDGDSYILYTGNSSRRCQLDSSSEWRTSLQTPYAQHQHNTRAENLPSPTDRSKLKRGQREAGTKEEYKQQPQRIAEKKKDHLQCQDTSIKEDVAAERRKQAVVEQVMVDQLCRAVISDPEQSTCSDACKEAQGLLGAGIALMCFRKRTIHETIIRTKSGLTENMLFNKLRFDSRIISRTNTLPFIQKGVYQHQHRQRKGKAYDLSDFDTGANLTFQSADHNLPENVKQNIVFTLCVTSIDETAMDYLKPSSLKLKEECSRQVVDDSEVFKKIQGIFRETLSKRGVWVITGLGKYFRQIDKNRNGFLSQAALKEALKVFHLEMPEGEFESLWLILDDTKSDKVDYGEFTRAIFGEMNEYRKAFYQTLITDQPKEQQMDIKIKKNDIYFHAFNCGGSDSPSLMYQAYMKLDFNKTGSVPMVDVRKCYCAKKHPLVLGGETAEEEIKLSFLEALGQSCSNPNEVSYSEFEDYYEGLSFGIVGDDDFVNILRNSWGI